TVEGVTFGYTVGGSPSFDAHYNAFGPGSTTYTSDPSLEGGTSGVLTLTFAAPVESLQFGLALSNFGDYADGASVVLFDASDTEIGTFTVSFSSGLYFYTSGLFTYGPSTTLVAKAEISFNAGIATRFVLDNLGFAAPPDVDFYRVDVVSGQTLRIATSTP